MFLLLDNYDSFTYNLLHYMGELGVEVEVRRNDAISADQALALGAEGIVISPGPCDPDKAGICLEVIEKASREINRRLPVLGVCLGHQCIGQFFGGTVVRAPKPMHGKISEITHIGSGVLTGIPSPFKATRYHSLTIDPDSLPDCLEVTATSGDGVIQGVSHRELPIHGVQFHPESIASEHGHQLIQNFLDIARTREAA
ncbi:MAG: aminodeoxychorismate/anthranilate synthase component II [Proteobacteria bacterium]|nr:aminodeoxychorismate/anthranilate synthase component II [Pseudomonadota bacterium]